MMFYHIDKNNMAIVAGPFSPQDAYIKRMTSCGNPEMLDLSGYDLVPVVYAELENGQKYGEPVVHADKVEIPAVAKTEQELLAETYVGQITPRQCRLYLDGAGLLDDVEAAIQTMPRAAQIEWEYALEIKRDHDLVLGMVQALGMTEADVHRFFLEASKL